MTATDTRTSPTTEKRYRPGSLEILGVILLLGILLRDPLRKLFAIAGMRTWATVFISVSVQAVPFLVLGVVVSGAIAAFVPASFFRRVLPAKAGLAVPVAGACGVLLPGCECGSIPIANRLMDRGVRPSAALAFLLSAPAINPVVLVATRGGVHHRSSNGLGQAGGRFVDRGAGGLDLGEVRPARVAGAPAAQFADRRGHRLAGLPGDHPHGLHPGGRVPGAGRVGRGHL